MEADKRALLQFHIAVVLWGFTAILGDLISLSALSLVWWRVGISGLVLAMVAGFLPKKPIQHAAVLKFLGIGSLVGLHWLCFYGSIKLANASIALITMSTSALFTVGIEWFSGMRKVSRRDVYYGLAIIPLMAIVAGGMKSDMNTGFAVGLLSALLLASFTVLNKKYIHLADASVVTKYEMTGAWLLTGTVLVIMACFNQRIELIPGFKDWILLLVLSLGCTVLPFMLSLYSLQRLSAFTINIVFNLEPVYGIVLAALLLHDYRDLDPGFYIGAVLISILVFMYPASGRIGNKLKRPD